jgi:hypothetical protein
MSPGAAATGPFDYNRVTTAAIVSHEVGDSSTYSKGGRRVSSSHQQSHQQSGPKYLSTSSPSKKTIGGIREEWKYVKWQDNPDQAPTNSSLTEVNVSLSRLDRKIVRLEVLLGKLTDRLSLQAENAIDIGDHHEEDEDKSTNV